MKQPCLHLMIVVRDQGFDIYAFCGKAWRKELYIESCAPFTDANPVTIMEHLTPVDITAPVVQKGRGRPKKRRIESQAATQELDGQPRRQYKCSQCQGLGHNKRQCLQQIE